MKDANTPEPAPIPNDRDALWPKLIQELNPPPEIADEMRGRDEFGRKKYGTPLQPFNGRKALTDIRQELYDALVYTQQEIEERRQIESGFVADALRTEPEYGAAVERLQDPRTVRLLHVAMGLCTEAGEFLDVLKKHIFYGKPIDDVNLVEELGDTSWYQRIGCDALEITFTEMLLRNVRKLRARFPEKFTEANANERDLDTERRILEGDPGK
jgi:NTP pyrophosphatase (non-canonical NTP hydrolase)